MSQRNSQNKKPSERNDSGIYKSVCSCITQTKWSYEGIWKTLNIKKSILFGAIIINEMRRDGFISARSNVLSTECYRKYKEMNLMWKMSSKLEKKIRFVIALMWQRNPESLAFLLFTVI